jgi:hypothetical protein
MQKSLSSLPLAAVATMFALAAHLAGEEFQVNSYTTAAQLSAELSRESGGSFVVVWHSFGSSEDDASYTSVQGQRYAPDGAPQGGNFQVNTYTTSLQSFPTVSLDADGDFVVVWRSHGSPGNDSSDTSIQGQRFAADGAAQGAQFQVNSYTTNLQGYPAVALDADGDFVVAWQSLYSSGGEFDYSIQGRRYNAAGSPAQQFQVSSYTTGRQDHPAIALDADGNFVVVWESFGSSASDNSLSSIQGKRFLADGTSFGQFQVNVYTSGYQRFPAVAMDADGDFVVVWESQGSNGNDSSGRSIQGQRYAAGGTPVGGQFQVNSFTSANQSVPAVSMDGDGAFVVTWHSDGSGGGDSSATSIQARRYLADGVAPGGEFQVNLFTSSYQLRPAVAVGLDGVMAAAWESHGSNGGDSSDFSIQGARLAAIFWDGFETGDALRWSTTVP